MTQNIITIKGTDKSNIKKVVNSWFKLNAENSTNKTFDLYQLENDFHVLKINETINNIEFFVLINYLQFPVKIEYDVIVEGYTVGNEFDVFNGKNLKVFFNTEENEFDEISITTDEDINYIYKMDDTLLEIDINNKYSELVLNNLENPEFVKFNKAEYTYKEIEKDSEKIEIRFKILLIFYFILIGLVNINILNNNSVENVSNLFGIIGMGFWSWILVDEKLRNHKKYFYKLTLMSLLIILNAEIFYFKNDFAKDTHTIVFVYFTFTTLISYKLIKILYIDLLKNEQDYYKLTQNYKLHNITTFPINIGLIYLIYFIFNLLK